MTALFFFVLAIFVAPFKSKSRLEVENAVLRHQLIVLRPKVEMKRGVRMLEHFAHASMRKSREHNQPFD